MYSKISKGWILLHLSLLDNAAAIKGEPIFKLFQSFKTRITKFLSISQSKLKQVGFFSFFFVFYFDQLLRAGTRGQAELQLLVNFYPSVLMRIGHGRNAAWQP